MHPPTQSQTEKRKPPKEFNLMWRDDGAFVAYCNGGHRSIDQQFGQDCDIVAAKCFQAWGCSKTSTISKNEQRSRFHGTSSAGPVGPSPSCRQVAIAWLTWCLKLERNEFWWPHWLRMRGSFSRREWKEKWWCGSQTVEGFCSARQELARNPPTSNLIFGPYFWWGTRFIWRWEERERDIIGTLAIKEDRVLARSSYPSDFFPRVGVAAFPTWTQKC